MKKYIFLDTSIVNVGGGQLYVKTKGEYLKSIGYRVYAFSYVKGDVVIKDLLEYKPYIITELEIPPSTYSEKTRIKILEKFKNLIDYQDGDEVIIESNTCILGLWGEYFAKNLNGRNLVYSITESVYLSSDEIKFIEYKCKKGELATISVNSFDKVLNCSKGVDLASIKVMRAYFSNVPTDFKCDKIDALDIKGKSICIIGRKDKDYVYTALKGCFEFAISQPNEFFTIAILGVYKNSDVYKKIKKEFSDIGNVKLIPLGLINPLPSSLFDKFDLFIGGAGSAMLPYRMGKTTIAMNVFENKIIGLLGYDATKSLVKTECELDFNGLLFDVFYTKNYKNREYIPAEPQPTSEEAYKSHMEVLDGVSLNGEYYDVENLNTTQKNKIKKILLKFPLLFKLLKKLK